MVELPLALFRSAGENFADNFGRDFAASRAASSERLASAHGAHRPSARSRALILADWSGSELDAEAAIGSDRDFISQRLLEPHVAVLSAQFCRYFGSILSLFAAAFDVEWPEQRRRPLSTADAFASGTHRQLALAGKTAAAFSAGGVALAALFSCAHALENHSVGPLRPASY